MEDDVMEHAVIKEYDILSAYNGIQALEMIRESMEDIALILLDIEMPVMDGREFLKQKKKINELAHIPVVVISSENSSLEQINMLKLGVNDYVTKPFIPDLMVRRVKNVLEYQNTFQILLREYKRDCDGCYDENKQE